jgi:hypothetical protein
VALASNEQWVGGFVVDTTTGEPVLTTVQTGAQMWSGFLRDPDGRLVVIYV